MPFYTYFQFQSFIKKKGVKFLNTSWNPPGGVYLRKIQTKFLYPPPPVKLQLGKNYLSIPEWNTKITSWYLQNSETLQAKIRDLHHHPAIDAFEMQDGDHPQKYTLVKGDLRHLQYLITSVWWIEHNKNRTYIERTEHKFQFLQ